MISLYEGGGIVGVGIGGYECSIDGSCEITMGFEGTAIDWRDKAACGVAIGENVRVIGRVKISYSSMVGGCCR
jgi:hypothetical protein